MSGARPGGPTGSAGQPSEPAQAGRPGAARAAGGLLVFAGTVLVTVLFGLQVFARRAIGASSYAIAGVLLGLGFLLSASARPEGRALKLVAAVLLLLASAWMLLSGPGSLLP
jgi:hypothetical protein